MEKDEIEAKLAVSKVTDDSTNMARQLVQNEQLESPIDIHLFPGNDRVLYHPTCS